MAYGKPWGKKAASATNADGSKKRAWNPSWGKKGPKIIPGSQYKPLLTPSAEQEAIFDVILNGTCSLIVEAYAGTGKTTTCVEVMHRLARQSPKLTMAYIIFAKRNREEAVGKCPSSAIVMTAHAFGLQALSKVFGKIEVDKEKVNRIATALVGPDDEKAELRYMLAKGIELGKDYMVSNRVEVEPIVEKHGLEICDLTLAEFCDKVLEGMRISALQTNVVSFSDMIWLPLKLNLTIPHFDLLLGDEVQDMNPARLELLFRAMGTSGRLLAVGDKKQSIFGFTGADRHAFAKIEERTGAITLPLHTTYRCGKAIVALATQFVPDYIAHPSNSEGEVRDVSVQDMLSDTGARAGDFILSRTNAPTVKIAMQLLKQGRKCNIQGRDIGQNLLWMIKRSKAVSVAGFSAWLAEWANAESERLTAKKCSIEHIVDKAACLDAFCEGQTSLEDVKKRISDMFDDAEPDETHRIILSTIHKAKGLERNRVFLLESSFTCKPKTEEDKIQEENVRYVSITRAKDSLFLVA